MRGSGLFGFWPSATFTVIILSLFAYINVTAHNNKDIREQVNAEMRAKRQSEIEMAFRTITEADWRIVKGEWTKEEGVYYIIKSKSVGDPLLFHDLPPNLKIGEKVRLENKQGADEPWEATSYDIDNRTRNPIITINGD